MRRTNPFEPLEPVEPIDPIDPFHERSSHEPGTAQK